MRQAISLFSLFLICCVAAAAASKVELSRYVGKACPNVNITHGAFEVGIVGGNCFSDSVDPNYTYLCMVKCDPGYYVARSTGGLSVIKCHNGVWESTECINTPIRKCQQSGIAGEFTDGTLLQTINNIYSDGCAGACQQDSKCEGATAYHTSTLTGMILQSSCALFSQLPATPTIAPCKAGVSCKSFTCQ